MNMNTVFGMRHRCRVSIAFTYLLPATGNENPFARFVLLFAVELAWFSVS